MANAAKSFHPAPITGLRFVPKADIILLLQLIHTAPFVYLIKSLQYQIKCPTHIQDAELIEFL